MRACMGLCALSFIQYCQSARVLSHSILATNMAEMHCRYVFVTLNFISCCLKSHFNFPLFVFVFVFGAQFSFRCELFQRIACFKFRSICHSIAGACELRTSMKLRSSACIHFNGNLNRFGSFVMITFFQCW